MFQPKHATLHPTQLPPGPLLGRSFEGKKSHVRSDSARGVWCLGGPGLATGTCLLSGPEACREHVH